MQPAKGQRKFRKETRYVHNRSDGLTKRGQRKLTRKLRRGA